MSINQINLLVYLNAAILSLLIAFQLSAQDIEQLIHDDVLRINVQTLVEDKEIVVGQEVPVMIELSSEAWFARPTEFLIPQLDNVIIKQRTNIVEKSSFEYKGKSWNRQRFYFSVFPQVAGSYQLPSITLQLYLSLPFQGITQGQFKTKKLSFFVIKPIAFNDESIQFASGSYTLTQTWDKKLSGLNVGDAIIRVITQETQGLFAMMLPSINLAKIEGLSVYQQKPELLDYNSGGSKKSQRISAITYIVEHEGDFIIPDVELAWWNINKKQVQRTLLPATAIRVGSVSVANKSIAFFEHNIKILTLIVISGLILCLVAVVIYKKKAKSKVSHHFSQKQIVNEIKQAANKQDNKGLIRWFYRYIDWYAFDNSNNKKDKEYQLLQTFSAAKPSWLKALKSQFSQLFSEPRTSKDSELRDFEQLKEQPKSRYKTKIIKDYFKLNPKE